MDYTHILSILRGKHRIGAAEKPAPLPDVNLGNNEQISQEMEKLVKTIPDAAKVLAEYKTAVTALATAQNAASQGLGKTAGLYQIMNTKIEDLVKNITFLEEHNASLNAIFTVGSSKAQEYAETIRDIGKEIGFSDVTLTKYVGGVNELTNGFLMSSKVSTAAGKNYRDQMIAFQTYAVETIGLSEDQATGFQKYAGVMGTTANNAAVAIREVSKAAADEMGIDALTAQHDILAGIGEMSDEVRLNYSKMPGSLEIAVLKAKALGVTMAQLDKMGESLMNIEQSVGQEMEYQLLTGKRLLVDGNKSFTNEFRLAKLTGNGTKQAELLADVLAEQGDDLETNYMARQKFAELTGLTDQELSAVITKNKIVKDLGLEGLSKLKGPALADAVAKLETEYAKDKKDGAEKLSKLKIATGTEDKRTTHERAVEDNLLKIADLISRQAGGGKVARKINVGEIQKEMPEKLKSFDDMRSVFDTLSPYLGKVTIASEALGALNAPVVKLISSFDKFAPLLNRVVTEFAEFTKIELKTGETKKVGVKDTLIIPDEGPILRPAKNDVIAAFRPNDVIHKTLSGIAKPAGGDSGMASMLAAFEKMIKTPAPAPAPAQSFDIKSFASAIATALQSVKIEAKIRTDDVYASTSMNNGKNIT